MRAKRAWGIESDLQFSRILGVAKSTLSNWKARNSIDFDVLFSKCKHINPSYLLNEIGDMYIYDAIDSEDFRSPLIRMSIVIVKHNDNLSGFSKKAKIKGGEFLFVNALLHSDESIVQGWIDSVSSIYKDVSINWILSGEGDVYRGIDSAPNETFKLQTDHDIDSQIIPLYDFDAAAGLIPVFNHQCIDPIDFLKIPRIPPADGAIYARGDSMSPLIKSGDIVVFKKVDPSINSILWGNIYILSYTINGDEYTVLKYIRHSDLDGYVRLESFNDRYDPKDIPASSITALALVKASITFHTIG